MRNEADDFIVMTICYSELQAVDDLSIVYKSSTTTAGLPMPTLVDYLLLLCQSTKVVNDQL